MLALAFTVAQVGAFRSRARAALQDEEEATARRRASLRRAHASRATSPQAEGRYAVGGMTSSSKSRGRRNMYMYMLLSCNTTSPLELPSPFGLPSPLR